MSSAFQFFLKLWFDYIHLIFLTAKLEAQ